MARAIAGSNRPVLDEGTRRDFLTVSTEAFAAIGAAAALWPFIDNMNPSADIRALAEIEIDLAPIELGQRITIKWQGRPVFIVHRSPEAIARAKADDNSPDLIDPALDTARVQQAQWLIVIGICTHLGCIPLGQRTGDPKGIYDGWFCPCHGSVYDLAGRVRRGPAPRNLDVPPYEFLEENRVRIG